MFFNNLLGLNWDLHICKWGRGTFITRFHYQRCCNCLVMRLYDYEFELRRRLPPVTKPITEYG